MAITLSGNFTLNKTGLQLSAGTSYLLDNPSLSNQSLIYAISSRRLRSAYTTNKAIGVGTSTTLGAGFTDYGFVGENFDSASLAAALTSGSGYIGRIYDQSGNGSDFADNPNGGTRPPVYVSGTAQTQNGKQLLFNRATGDACLCMISAGSRAASAPFTLYVVMQYLTPYNIAQGGHAQDGFSGSRILFGVGGSNQYQLYAGGSAGFLGALDVSYHCIFAEWNGSTGSLWVDGNSVVTTGITGTNSVSSGTRFVLGGNQNVGWVGNYCEGVLFEGTLTSGDRAILRASAQSYWGAP